MSSNTLRNGVDILEAFVDQEIFSFSSFPFFSFFLSSELCSNRKNVFLQISPTETRRLRPQGWDEHPGTGDGLLPGTD